MSKKKIIKKEKDAKAFEALLTPENKKTIERILSSLDETSCYSARFANQALESIIGEGPTRLIADLFSQPDLQHFFSDIKQISPENRKYLSSLYGLHRHRLWGVLTNQKFGHPKGWLSISHLSTTYDGKDCFIRFEILNCDREKLVFDNSITEQIYLISAMLEMMIENTNEIRKIKKNLGVEKRNLTKLKKMVRKFEQMLFTTKS